MTLSLWLKEKENSPQESSTPTVDSDELSVQTIDQGWNRSLVVRVGKQNQLFVDEVVVGEVPGLSPIQVLLKKI